MLAPPIQAVTIYEYRQLAAQLGKKSLIFIQAAKALLKTARLLDGLAPKQSNCGGDGLMF